MANLIQILLYVMIAYHFGTTKSKPIGEIIFKKSSEFGFKPLPLKPFAFFKEKYTPLGIFGIKKGIVKRDLESAIKVPVTKELTRLPAEVYETPLEVPISVRPPAVGRAPIGPVPAPPPPPVIITPTAKVNGLHTDIGRDELINSYLNAVEGPIQEEKVLPPIANSITPEKPKNESPITDKEDNPFRRGSRLALYFGNLLFDILAQFLGGTRGQATEFSNINKEFNTFV